MTTGKEVRHFWVQYYQESGKIETFIAANRPSLIEHYVPLIPYPANINEIPNEYYGDGKYLLGSSWKITISPFQDKIEFLLVDKNGNCEPITYKHFHHAVYYQDFQHYREDVKRFLLSFEKFYEEFNNLKERIMYLRENKYISINDNYRLLDRIEYINSDFIKWIKGKSPQNIRLLLAIKRLQENESKLAEIKISLDEISQITQEAVDFVNRMARECNKIANHVYNNLEIINETEIKDARERASCIGQAAMEQIMNDRSTVVLTENDIANIRNNLKRRPQAFFDYCDALRLVRDYEKKADDKRKEAERINKEYNFN